MVKRWTGVLTLVMGVILMPAQVRAVTWETYATGINGPQGLAFDAVGNLYVVGNNDKKLYRVPVGGGAAEVVASGFQDPWGVAVDEVGVVYVTSEAGDKIYRVQGGLAVVINTTIDRPNQMIFNPADGMLYAAVKHGVARIDPATGAHEMIWDHPDVNGNAWGVTISPQGVLHVSFDAASQKGQVLRLDANGQGGYTHTVLGEVGSTNVRDIVFDLSGNLYWGRHKQEIWLLPGGQGPPQLWVDGDIKWPVGLAIHPVTGDLYVAEKNRDRILKIGLGVDATGPTVAITAPADGAVINQTLPTMIVTFSDADSGVNTSTLAVSVDGVDVTGQMAGQLAGAGGSVKGTPTTALADGLHTAQATIENTSGIPSTAVITFTVDSTAPVLVVSSPVNGQTVNSLPLMVSGTLTDTGSGPAGLSLNGSGLSLAGGGFSAAIGLDVGMNTLTFVGQDTAGNVVQQVHTVIYDPPDVSPPVAVLTSPLAGQNFMMGTVPVAGTLTDDRGVDAASVVLNVDGVPVDATVVLPSVGFTATGLADGQHTVTLDASDTSGNVAVTQMATFTVDAAAPVLSVTTPAQGALLSHPSATVTGTATDVVGPVTVTLNGVGVPLDGDGNFSQAVVLLEGLNTLTVTATDATGHVSTQVITVTYMVPDTTAPVITLSSHPSDVTAANASVTLAGSVSDDLAVAGLTLNGQALALDGAGNFSHALTLAEGPNVLTLVATDGGGNIAMVVRTLTYVAPDVSAPSILLTSPASGTVGALPLEVAAVFQDDEGVDPATAVVKLDGTTITGQLAVSITGVNGALVGLTDGQHILTVDVKDTSGNAAPTAAVTFVVDTAGPVLTVNSPAANQNVSTGTLAVTGNVVDVGSAVASLTVNGQTVNVSPTGAFATTVALTEGMNTLMLVATDGQGHVSSETLLVTYTIPDGTSPQITLTAPGPGSVQTTLPVMVAVDLQDDTAVDVATVVVSLDGVPVGDQLMVSPTGVSGALAALAEGAHTLTVTASDTSGNAAAPASVTFTVDTQAPVWNLTSHPADVTLNTSTTTLTGRVIDAVGVSGATLNGEPLALDVDGAFSHPVTLVEGLNSFTFVAQDGAGHIAQLVRTLTYVMPDTSAPTVSIAAPAPGSLAASLPVTVTAALADDDAVDPASVVVKVDGQAVTNQLTVTGTQVTGALVGLADGSHTLTVDAADTSGNAAATAQSSFTVDVTAPLISLTSAVDVTVNAAIFTVTGTVVDAVGGVSATLNEESLTLGAGGAFSQVVTLAEGANTLTVQATDGAGHTATATATVTYAVPVQPPAEPESVQDITAPVVTLTSPAETAYSTTDAVVALTGTVTDDHGAVASLTLGGVVLSLDGGGGFSTTVALQEGLNALTLVASDAAGNVVTTVLTITRTQPEDAIPLFITVSQPPSDPFSTNQSTYVVEGRTKAGAQVQMDDVPAAVDPQGRFTQVVSLTEGNNAFLITATHGQQTESQLLEIIADTLAPEVVWSNPTSDGQLLDGARIQVSVAEPAGTSGSGVQDSGLTLTVDGQAVVLTSAGPGMYTAQTPVLEAAQAHTFVLSGNDNAGNILVSTLVSTPQMVLVPEDVVQDNASQDEYEAPVQNPAPPVSGPLDSLLVSTQQADGFQVAKMMAEGDLEVMTAPPGSHFLPAVTSGEQAMIYAARNASGSMLYKRNGSGAHQVLATAPPGGVIGYSSPSPGGSLVVFAMKTEEGQGLYMVKAGEPEGMEPITAMTESADLPDVSSRGEVVYTMAGAEGEVRIVHGVLMEGQGVQEKMLVGAEGSRINTYPVFSADETSVYFLSDAGGVSGIYKWISGQEEVLQVYAGQPGLVREGGMLPRRLIKQNGHVVVLGETIHGDCYFRLQELSGGTVDLAPAFGDCWPKPEEDIEMTGAAQDEPFGVSMDLGAPLTDGAGL